MWLAIPFSGQTPQKQGKRDATNTHAIQIKKTNEVEQINVNLGENESY